MFKKQTKKYHLRKEKKNYIKKISYKDKENVTMPKKYNNEQLRHSLRFQ